MSLETIGRLFRQMTGSLEASLSASRMALLRRLADWATGAGEEKYSDLTGLVNECAYSIRIGPDGRRSLEWVMGAYEGIIGLTLPELRSRASLVSLIHTEDLDVFRQHERLLLLGGPSTAEYRVLKAGEVKWIRDTCRPKRGTSGRVHRVHGVAQDITEYKLAERELKNRTEDLAILNAINTNMAQPIDLDLVLNDTLEYLLNVVNVKVGSIQLYSWESGNLTHLAQRGFSADMLELAQVPNRAECGIYRAVQAGETAVIEPSAKGVWADSALDRPEFYPLVFVPIRSRADVIGVLSLLGSGPRLTSRPGMMFLQALANQLSVAVENRELADRDAQIEVLREVDRLRSELIANVSHELRTPLGIIKLFGTALLDPDIALDKETEHQFLIDIDRETDKLAQLVDDLLGMAQIQKVSLRLRKQPADIVQLVRGVVTNLGPTSAKHRFAFDGPDAPLLVEMDSHLIERVLNNLLSNAVKYSPAGGAISVRLEADQAQVLIHVEDDGIGIPQPDLERIFERFYRVSNEVTQNTGGVGLGLALARGIVEAHGGRIWAQSVVGAGSHFFVSLPRGG